MKVAAAVTASAAVTLTAIGLGVASLSRATNADKTACFHLDKLIAVERQRIIRSRVGTEHESYYIGHPAELRRFLARSRRAVLDLGGAEC